MKSGSTVAVAANIDASCSCIGVDSAELFAAYICGESMWRMSKFSSITDDNVAAALARFGSPKYRHMHTVLL